MVALLCAAASEVLDIGRAFQHPQLGLVDTVLMFRDLKESTQNKATSP